MARLDVHADDPALSWPVSHLGEALEALARRSGLAPSLEDLPPTPSDLAQGGDGGLGQWIEAAAGHLGFEAELVGALYPEVGEMVRGAAPAILRLPGEGEPRFLALLRGGRRRISLLAPDQAVHRLPPEAVRAVLCREIETPFAVEVDRLLDEARVPWRRRTRARGAILRQQLGARGISGCWLLRLPPGRSLGSQAHRVGLTRHLLVFLGAHAVQYVLWLVSWGIVGLGALQGQLDWGWLLAWALLLLTLVPLRMLVTWSQGRLAIGVGGLLKRRLLHGALRLEPDEIRHQGVGQLLGRVLESEAVEVLALNGGFQSLVAGIELIMVIVVLVAGAGGILHVFLLLGWLACTFLIGWRYTQLYGRWTETRLAITHDLVESMVGHQTRLAQEPPTRWHDEEDQALVCYLAQSKTMDRTKLLLMGLISRGWLILGLLGLVPAFLSGQGTAVALAMGLGGVLSAYLALRKLVGGLAFLLNAAVAWQQVAAIYHAAARPEVIGSPAFALAANSGTGDPDRQDQPLLDAQGLTFRYRPRGELALQDCSLQIRSGDRVLLEGPSGSGKSTLAALLTGLRVPEAGLLFLGGLDRQALGSAGWRRRVVAAPQFHENHVLTETFAFNLLMGRGWPPGQRDLEEAESLCRELGLGDLLERMPAGLLQMVGESGWQLSHGERSRLYIARALLQGADVVILDESFASLDPENLRQALRCVVDRVPTLVVIAHP